MKKEDQLREVKKNSTNLEKKLEYERWVASVNSLSVRHIHFGHFWDIQSGKSLELT